MFFSAFGFIYSQGKLKQQSKMNNGWQKKFFSFLFLKSEFLSALDCLVAAFLLSVYIEYLSIVNKFQKSTGWPVGTTNNRSNFI